MTGTKQDNADRLLLELLKHPEHQLKFALSAEQWTAFEEAMNAPPSEQERVKALLNSRPAWEKR